MRRPTPSKENAVEVEGHTIKVSSLNKVIWPAADGQPPITKGEMLAYYAAVGPFMLPHLKDRPIAVMRYPEGLNGPSFFQHRWEVRLPEFVDKVEIYSLNSKKPRRWMMCNNLATLVWLAQHEAIEIHAWYSRTVADEAGLGTDFGSSEEAMRASAINFPDFMIIDLDPTNKDKKGFNLDDFKCTVDVALATKQVLDTLKLRSFVKTSGKTGLHIYVPLKRLYTHDEMQAMAAVIGREVFALRPKDVTLEFSPSKRPAQRVMFDFNQNTLAKTLACVYSLRPFPGAPASFPVSWSDLPKVDPRDYNLHNVPALLKKTGDLWAGILDERPVIAR